MFVQGQVYKRSTLHDQYGGQRQGGISTPRGVPVIFLFTGSSGEQHGYEDGWTAAGIFEYSGRGQVGDMEFMEGNLAVRDHATLGKDLHLFQNIPKPASHVRYVGQFVATGHHSRAGKDRQGNDRQIIVFELSPIGTFTGSPGGLAPVDEESDLEGLSIEELRRRALDSSAPSRDAVARRTWTRARSKAIKLYAEQRASGVCEGCGKAAPFKTAGGRNYLEVHHTTRLSDGGPDHPDAVVAVCPNCHRRAHHSSDRTGFNEGLREIARTKESGRV